MLGPNFDACISGSAAAKPCRVGEGSLLILQAPTEVSYGSFVQKDRGESPFRTLGQFRTGGRWSPIRRALAVVAGAAGLVTMLASPAPAQPGSQRPVPGYVADAASRTAPKTVTAAQQRTLTYVTNFNANTVSMINTATNTVIATIPVGAFPIRVAVGRVGAIPKPRQGPTKPNRSAASAITTQTNSVGADITQRSRSPEQTGDHEDD
jgi:YVTN family beta-propeller protein